MADKIRWCLRQKRGMELVKLSENLSRAYLVKAENALASMRANADNPEWEISSSYYAMYFSLYAILMRLGVKCEIHSCTLEFMQVYLSKHFTADEIRLLEDSCSARIEAQYYCETGLDDKTREEMTDAALDFHLKCKTILAEITEKETQDIREDLQKRIKNIH